MNHEDPNNQSATPPAPPAPVVREYDCKDVAAVLSGLIDDVLDSQMRHAVERHLAMCPPCADKIDEAERLNDTLADSIHVVDELPEGFADAVFASTTRRDRLVFRQPRWMAWSGWVAAAASLTLAASLFYMENNTPDPINVGGNSSENREDVRTDSVAAIQQYASFLPQGVGSKVRGNVIPKPGGADIHTVVNVSNSQPIDVGAPATFTNEEGDIVGPPAAVEQEIPLRAFGLSIDDQDTLYQTATVLDMLFDFELTSLSVAERMRNIIVYDDLLNRLADVRKRLQPEDRLKLSAAEAMLYRVVNGPVSVDDLIEMRNDAGRMELIGHIERMIGHTDPDNSM